MTIFATAMIMMMILVCGIGVDLMRNEMERTQVQATMDRAVLAAADLDQTLDPEAVVKDYFAKSGMSQYLTSVTVDEGLNYRTVSATTSGTTPTRFMHLMGVNELPLPARSTAEERVPKVEISLVLDVSGSMGRNNRMVNMRRASKEFVTEMIRPETDGQISISVVPYSEHVNVGPEVFQALPKTSAKHSSSHCAEFPDDAFSSTVLDPNHLYIQMQHFQWYEDSQNRVDNPSCPQREFERVFTISDDDTRMKWMIDRLQPRTQTSIFIGMKWGAALLDPSFRPIQTAMAMKGKQGPFPDRPADYSDVDTLKTIVVMTDGRNTDSYRLTDYAYSTVSQAEHWKNNNFWNFLNKHVDPWDHHLYYERKYAGSYGDVLTDNICDAAKAKGIVIWAIGFEVDNHGASVMQNCASSPSHFFRVEGIEISEAFKAIAKQINQLRLTQ